MGKHKKKWKNSLAIVESADGPDNVTSFASPLQAGVSYPSDITPLPPAHSYSVSTAMVGPTCSPTLSPPPWGGSGSIWDDIDACD
jgi:hypothetical protein